MIPEKRVAEVSRWWENAVIYQIYPRSFRDSNGDGIGDLPGITEKLDYLSSLGVDGIWLSPIYPSPMKDGGYDVANYKDIDPRFGTLADFDKMVSESHARGIRVIMDLVMNHSSDQHEWFQEARSSKDDPKRDWYIWSDPKPDGSPPNNWPSFFDGSPGSAWTLDEITGQYYFHKFDPSQPDLNMRNPQVREAMKDTMRFWLERGVDGFRMDVIDHIFQAEDLEDMESNPNFRQSTNGPDGVDHWKWRDKYILTNEVEDLIREIMPVIHQYGGVGIGEIGTKDIATIQRYQEAGLDLPFNFSLLNTAFKAPALKNTLDTNATTWHEGRNAMLGNHDNPRLASRIGDENVRAALAMLLLDQPSDTAFLYYGEEIGMKNGKISEEQNQDPQGKRMGIEHSRDPERTPMQWEDVTNQMDDPNSLFSYVQRLISLRKTHPSRSGQYVEYPLVGDTVFMRGFKTDGGDFLGALNTGELVVLNLPEDFVGGNVYVSSNGKLGKQVGEQVELAPGESVYIEARHGETPLNTHNGESTIKIA